jgi:hypothetical protein
MRELNGNLDSITIETVKKLSVPDLINLVDVLKHLKTNIDDLLKLIKKEIL